MLMKDFIPKIVSQVDSEVFCDLSISQGKVLITDQISHLLGQGIVWSFSHT